MKMVKIFSLFIAAAGLLASCENDIDPKIPEDAVNPQLTAPTEGGTHVFLKTDEAKEFKTFVWTSADFKLETVVKYNLEVDAANGDFSNRKIISSNISSPFNINVGDFNKGLLAAGFTDGQAHNIKVRISANNALASESIDMTITTYFDAEPWSIIGSAIGGWNPENDKFMTYNKESETYSLTLDMKPGEFKFRASKKDSDPWKYNYGINGGKTIDNGTNIKLKDGGDNIGVSGGNYTVTLDLKNEQFSIVQNSAAEFTIWTDVVLDAVGSGISADNATAKPDDSSWNWGNVILADNDGKPSSSAAVYTWKWTAVTLEAAEGFKLRTLKGVAAPENGVSFDAGFDKVDTEASSAKVVDKDGNLSVTEKGKYTIELTIDATNGDAKKIVIKEYFEYPPQLFAIGDAANGWNWGDGHGVAMIPVHSHPEQFWRIMYLEGGKGLKFAPEEAWGNDFGVTDDAPVAGVYQKGGSNITVQSSGYYTVVVNLADQTIELAEPAVYGMGDAFGGWNAATPANKFTVDNAAKTISYASAPANGNLRMHATASTLKCDWWQAEFNIIGADIVYRAAGGDQSGMPSVVEGQKITLNFATMKGEVQ